MPNIPMAVLAMLTCARIGAVHCVAYAGTPAKRLAERLDAAPPKLIFTASGGFEPVPCHERTEDN
jgi:propionyl-CoA synthetase